MQRLAPLTMLAGTRRGVILLLAILLVAACEDGDDVLAPVSTRPVSRVAGTVISSVTNDPVAGAEVSIGAVTVTTGPDGRFDLPGLTVGLATLRCVAPDFWDFGEYIALPPGSITRNITLAPLPPLRISARMGPRDQFVTVFRADKGVKDAVVTVNGVSLPVDWEAYWDPTHDGGFYRGSLPDDVAAGLLLFLEVVHGIPVQATGNVPEAPVLTTPATGSVFTVADSITFTWTSATDPDGFEVWGCFDHWWCGPIAVAPGTARELRIAASRIDAAETVSVVIGVVAINEGSFTGPADLDSTLSIRNGNPAAGEITISR